MVVAAAIGRLALNCEELAGDLFLIRRELLGDWGENLFKFEVLVLSGKGLGPIQREVEVAASIVDAANLACRRLIIDEKLAGRFIERVGEDLRFSVAKSLAEMLERDSEREKLPERITAEIVLRKNLLDVLRRRTSGTRFEKTSAIHQRNNGKHLGAGSEFKNGKQVSQVVAQHVARDRDGILAGLQPLERKRAGVRRRQNLDVHSRRIVVLEVSVDSLDQLGVMRPVLVQPKDCRSLAGAGAVYRKLNPIADGGVLGLACAPDVTLFDLMLEEDFAGGVDHADGALCRDLEGFVVGAVFFCFLCHQSDVRHGAHGARIEGPMLFAKLDDGLVNAG